MGASAYALGSLGNFDASGNVTASTITAQAVSAAKSISVGGQDVKSYLVPAGAILMFAKSCPNGWTHFVDLDNVFPMVRGRIAAMRDRAEVVGAGDDPLGQQKAGGELAIGARSPHDHCERLIVQTHFERLLGRRPVGVRRADTAANADDVDRSQRLGHAVI